MLKQCYELYQTKKCTLIHYLSLWWLFTYCITQILIENKIRVCACPKSGAPGLL